MKPCPYSWNGVAVSAAFGSTLMTPRISGSVSPAFSIRSSSATSSLTPLFASTSSKLPFAPRPEPFQFSHTSRRWAGVMSRQAATVTSPCVASWTLCASPRLKVSKSGLISVSTTSTSLKACGGRPSAAVWAASTLNLTNVRPSRCTTDPSGNDAAIFAAVVVRFFVALS